MNDRIEPPRTENPAGWQGMRWDKGNQTSTSAGVPVQDASTLNRFLGGSPVAVFTRLLIMSVVVGALLIWLDIRPYEIFRALERFSQRIWLMGFDAIREIATYVIAGAVIVVPVWLFMRLMNMRGK